MKKVAEKLDGLVLSCAMSSQEVSGSLAMLSQRAIQVDIGPQRESSPGSKAPAPREESCGRLQLVSDWLAATLSEEQLVGDAKFLKPALLGKIRAGVGGEHSSALYDITVAEAKEKSWLKGPYSPAEMDQRYNGRWLPVRRFPVVQKDKLRPIDDLRENRVNDTFSSTERATLDALDHLVWASIFLMLLCWKSKGPL